MGMNSGIFRVGEKVRLRNIFLPVTVVLLLCSTLLVDVDSRNLQEFVKGTLFYLIILFSAIFLAEKFGFPGFLKGFRPSVFSLVLALFAMVSMIHAISHIVDTEIPRLKAIYRLIYALFLIFITSPLAARFSRLHLLIGTVLLFCSFLFTWMFIVGSVRSIPVVLLVVYGWLELGNGEFNWRKLSGDIFLILIAVSLAALAVSNVYNRNHLNGAEAIFRFGGGALLFLLVRREKDAKTAHIVTVSLLVIAAVHILLIFFSIFFLAMNDPDYSVISTKKSSLAGVNVNDISGYLIILFPLVLGAVFNQKEIKTRRTIVLALLFLSGFFLLLILKSRAAWPIMFFSCALFIYLLKRYNTLKSDHYRKILIWLIAGTFALLALLTVIIVLKAQEIKYLTSFSTLDLRFDLWRLAARTLAESPVFGIGSENYVRLSSQSVTDPLDLASFSDLAEFFRQSGAFIHCHNLFLQLWLDGGFVYMVGISGLFFFGIMAGISGSQSGEYRGLRIGAAVALTAVLFQGMLNYHFMNLPTWFSVWLLLGISVRGRDVDTPAPSRERNVPFSLIGILSLCLAVLGIHLAVLSNRGDSIRALRDVMYKNSLDAYVLESGGQLVPAEMIAESNMHALRAASYYSDNAELNQLSGEISFFAFNQLHEEAFLTAASSRYEACFRNAPWSAFCAQRLADIASIQNPKDTQKHRLLSERARALDPFDLLHRSRLRKL